MRDRERVRLADVAARAGVSQATVSRVLNDRPGIAAATRERVLVTVDVLGYEGPVRLRARTAGLVGVVVPDLADPGAPELLRALEAGLAARGTAPVLCAAAAGGRGEDEALEALLGRGVVGVVLVGGRHGDPSADVSGYRRLVERRLPVVALGAGAARPEGDRLLAPVVAVDDRAAADLAVAHLVALGHRRVGLVGGAAPSATTARRVAGFELALRARLGVESASGLVVRTRPTVEGGQEAVRRLLERGATAVVATGIALALGVVRGAREAGLAVPRDLSVVAHGDPPLVGDFCDPPLTTLRPPLAGMAAEAVVALLDPAGDARTGRTPRELLFRADLVVRASTAPPPRR